LNAQAALAPPANPAEIEMESFADRLAGSWNMPGLMMIRNIKVPPAET